MEQYVHFYLTTPYCGFDEDKYLCFKQEQTKEHLNEYLDELVQDHTKSLMYLAIEDIDSDDYETLEDYDDAIEQAQEFLGQIVGVILISSQKKNGKIMKVIMLREVFSDLSFLCAERPCSGRSELLSSNNIAQFFSGVFGNYYYLYFPKINDIINISNERESVLKVSVKTSLLATDNTDRQFQKVLKKLLTTE